MPDDVVDDPAAMFAGMKKKKKAKKVELAPEAAPVEEKKVVVPETPAPAVAEPVAPVAPTPAPAPTPVPAAHAEERPAPVDDDSAVFDFGEKKKKKKKAFKLDDETVEAEPSSASVDAPSADAAAGGAAPDSFDFGEKKKKKKGKRPDIADFEAQLRLEGMLDDQIIDAGAEETVDVDGGDSKAKGGDPWMDSTRDYTYQELLMRVFSILKQNNPNLAGEVKKFIIVPPQVAREGTKKTVFANVVDISKRMRREPDHLIQYLFAELGTNGSIDGSQRLVIKGRFQQKQIENVLKRYIVEYVTCKTCKSGDTLLAKENRLFFLQCQSCGSTKSVSAIKTGFVAQTQKRAAQRAAAGV